MINKDKFIELLQNKYTNEQLAAYFNCSVTTIKRFKTKNNLVGIASNSKILNVLEIKNIEKLINEGFSLKLIVDKTKISPHRIRKYISFEYIKKLELNNSTHISNRNRVGSLEKIVHPEPFIAYIVGLLQADGCLTKEGVVTLTSKDLQLVENFKQFCGCNIIQDSRGYFNAQVKDIRYTEKFKEISGIGYNKTFINYNIPSWIISDNIFVNNFIAGVFDGDGTVFNKRDNELTLAIEQHSSQENYLLQLNNFLNWKPYNYKGSFRIQTSNSSTIKEFAKWYTQIPYALNRKKEKILSRCKI